MAAGSIVSVSSAGLEAVLRSLEMVVVRARVSFERPPVRVEGL